MSRPKGGKERPTMCNGIWVVMGVVVMREMVENLLVV